MQALLKYCLQFQIKALEVTPFQRRYSSTHKSESYVSCSTFWFPCMEYCNGFAVNVY